LSQYPIRQQHKFQLIFTIDLIAWKYFAVSQEAYLPFPTAADKVIQKNFAKSRFLAVIFKPKTYYSIDADQHDIRERLTLDT
jgi:hypothetical protein